MSMEVIQPGLLSTIQDLGRYGYQKHGVIVSGAMDPLSLRMANLLVGNLESDAAIEITLLGPKLRFHDNHLIAICGGDFKVFINNEPIPLWRPVWVRQGSVLQFGNLNSGCRAYLAISGGINVPQVLGSRSTYFRAGLGGFQGRSLRKGDILSCNPPTLKGERWIRKLEDRDKKAGFSTVFWYISKQALAISYVSDPIIRMIRGPQYETFDTESQAGFNESLFRINPQSDRMGYRLNGPILKQKERRELISEPVCFGTIQVPPNGEPIVLLADRQTTGGYPIIGYVVSVDFPMLAQLKPGDSLQFQEITLRKAQELFFEREKAITVIKLALNRILEGS